MSYEPSSSDGGQDTNPRGIRLLFNGRPEEDSGQQDKPARQRTQKDQDAADDAARQKANKDLVQSWMDRLQLISVITTFFASTEAGLLQTTSPTSGNNTITPTLNAANAGIIGALIMHSFAAIISFLASFVLVRYKLIEAKKEELKAEAITGSGLVTSPTSIKHHDVEKTADANHRHSPPRDSTTGEPIQSCDPRLEQVGPFSSKQPPTALLSRCHSLCISLAAVGFILALMGILCYAWAVQPLSVAAFSSGIMALCLISGAMTLR